MPRGPVGVGARAIPCDSCVKASLAGFSIFLALTFRPAALLLLCVSIVSATCISGVGEPFCVNANGPCSAKDVTIVSVVALDSTTGNPLQTNAVCRPGELLNLNFRFTIDGPGTTRENFGFYVGTDVRCKFVWCRT